MTAIPIPAITDFPLSIARSPRGSAMRRYPVAAAGAVLPRSAVADKQTVVFLVRLGGPVPSLRNASWLTRRWTTTGGPALRSGTRDDVADADDAAAASRVASASRVRAAARQLSVNGDPRDGRPVGRRARQRRPCQPSTREWFGNVVTIERLLIDSRVGAAKRLTCASTSGSVTPRTSAATAPPTGTVQLHPHRRMGTRARRPPSRRSPRSLTAGSIPPTVTAATPLSRATHP